MWTVVAQTQRRLEREVRRAKCKLMSAKKLGSQTDITAVQELVSRRQSVTR